MGYARSLFQIFENYLRIVVDLDEDDIQKVSKQKNSSFITYEITPGVYSIKDISQLFTPWVIMKEPCKLNKMIIP